ncbi:MAG: sodium-dependent bicarbonate transport family permease [Methylibium sp.]|uniref:sodium-dependent bicarbonate transport family permease n=1 Tax=Methylibium sp. TaxID=2067992 RepID=UPI0017D2C830|nr:sodium-dependent bicarbonate transport family permease [Methylibium sp.]MBA3597846.1 sodium-dependent bicarbonate transport family permease [Methylibium sp.]
MIDVVVLFFLLGVLARIAKSDLRLPEALYETLSIYLLLAIGLKGGIELSRVPLAAFAPQVMAMMLLGFAIPFAMFPRTNTCSSCCRTRNTRCLRCCSSTRRWV